MSHNFSVRLLRPAVQITVLIEISYCLLPLLPIFISCPYINLARGREFLQQADLSGLGRNFEPD